MSQTKIEWTATTRSDGKVFPGYTFNPWHGCVKISPGCKFCYAEAMDHRWGVSHWGVNAQRLILDNPHHWQEPMKWNDYARKNNVRLKVFCASMADVFEDNPAVVDSRHRLWSLIINTPHLDWLILTKRPENITDMLPTMWMIFKCPENIWFGVSICESKELHTVWPMMEQFNRSRFRPSVVFISAEPLLDDFDEEEFDNVLDPKFSYKLDDDDDDRQWPPDWVIVGGESGANARDCKLEWITKIVLACNSNNIPIFVKQLGTVLGRKYKLRGKADEMEQWPVSIWKQRQFPK